ncbi:MAG: energy transducer TonB [Parerythrobacter sp.]
MDTARLRPEEIAGLAVAVVLHLALLAALALQFATAEPAPPREQRVTVSLSQEVGLTSAAPQPVPESRAAAAPTLNDTPAPALVPAPAQVDPAPRAVETVAPSRPVTRPTARATPRSRPIARPTRRAQAATKPPTQSRNQPRSQPSARSAPAAKASTPAARSGASRLDDAFTAGIGSSATSSETRAPAAAFGAREQAALSSAINRQLKPHWRGKAPSGLEAERLVTVLTWDMNADGSLRGTPRVVTQSGITDANRAQADRHAEVAIAAVKLAAPFNLPPEFYDKWKRVRDWRFDRRL